VYQAKDCRSYWCGKLLCILITTFKIARKIFRPVPHSGQNIILYKALSQNTQNIILYIALTVKTHKISFCTKHLQSKHTKYHFAQSTYSQNTQNIVLYKALTVKTHKISFCTKHSQSKHTKYRFLQSTYSQNTQNIVLYKALTVKTHKTSAMVLVSAVDCTHTAMRSEPVTWMTVLYTDTDYQFQIRTLSLERYSLFCRLTSARLGRCRNIDGLYTYIFLLLQYIKPTSKHLIVFLPLNFSRYCRCLFAVPLRLPSTCTSRYIVSSNTMRV
jgi:hypothetical protein